MFADNRKLRLERLAIGFCAFFAFVYYIQNFAPRPNLAVLFRFSFPREHNQIFRFDSFPCVRIKQNRCHPTRSFPIPLFFSVLLFVPTIYQVAPLTGQKVIKLGRHQTNLTERERFQCVPCRNVRWLLPRSVNYFFAPLSANCSSKIPNAFSINV